ncbi:hypothetical protein ES708_17963 [subsurface metagenome]
MLKTKEVAYDIKRNFENSNKGESPKRMLKTKEVSYEKVYSYFFGSTFYNRV